MKSKLPDILKAGESETVEFMKEGQTDRDFSGALNTGQMLSIPFVLAGVCLVVRAFKRES